MKKIPWLINIVLISIFITVFYGKIILHPNSYLFSSTGDGISSYYNQAWHNQFDNSFVQFEGMNYPYHEHVMFSVNNPLFSFLIRSLSNIFPGILNYSVSIQNLSIILSFLFSSLIIFQIFRILKLNNWLSNLYSIAITILSPQILRFGGHFTLSYLFLIPLIILLNFKFIQSNNKLIWSIIICLTTLLFTFIHPYCGFISASFSLLFYLFSIIFNNKKYFLKISTYIYIFIQSLLPLLLLKIFVLLTDNHFDRTNNPYGFLVYNASYKTIFIPNLAPLKPLIDKIFTVNQNWEGLAYIGFGGIFFVVYFIYLSVIESSKKNKCIFLNEYSNSVFIKPFIIAGVLFLLFSTGFPFNFGLSFILDWFPFIKNFRSTGRFAWVFYYTSLICGVYIINNYLIAKKQKWLKITLYIIPFLLIIEGLQANIINAENITKTPDYFNDLSSLPEYKKSLTKINSNNYQAILPLPFYHRGSENFTIDATDKILQLSTILSFHTKLPIVGSYLAHTSISESKKSIQLISPTYYKKEIYNDFPNKKPFLVVYSKEQISEGENSILSNSKSLYDCELFEVKEINFDDLFINTSKNEIEKFNSLKIDLYEKNNFLVNDTSTLVYYNDFIDNQSNNSDIYFRNIGSFSGKLNDYNKIAEFQAQFFQSDTEYNVSFWIYNNGENSGQDRFNCMSFINEKRADGKSEWLSVTNPAYSKIINGNWSLVEFNFKTHSESINTLMIKGNDGLKTTFIIDDLLIKKADCDVYRIFYDEQQKPKELFYNNQQIMY